MGKKRVNGEGSGYLDHARNRWFWAQDINGKRVKASGRTLTEAKANWAAKNIAASTVAARLGPQATGKTLLSEWLEGWFETILPNVRYSTQVGYRTVIDKHLVPHVGHLALHEITSLHVRELQNKLLKTLSNSTVRQVRSVLNQALAHACEMQVLTSNPVASVKAPQKPSSNGQALSLTEAQAVIRAAGGPREKARWLLGLSTGLRQGEVLGLRWSDLVLTTTPFTLTVGGTAQRQTRKGIVVGSTKTKASRRTLLLDGDLVNALTAWQVEQAQQLTALGLKHDPKGFVFTSEVGTITDATKDRKNWLKLLRKANVDPVRLHDARHTAGTLMMEEGVGAEVVQQVLGHTTIRTTVDIYGHLSNRAGGTAIAANTKLLLGG